MMKNGFTLIELLVVLVIISLVSAFVAPKFSAPLDNLHLKTASKRIAAIMRYSRSRAISEKESRVCFFDFDNQQVLVFPGSAVSSGDTDEQLKADAADIQYELPEGVGIEKAVSGDTDVQSGVFPVVFFADGSSSGGEIVLTNKKGRSSKIQIDFITGIVSLTGAERVG